MIQSKAEDLQLLEKVDLIVSEWMGTLLLVREAMREGGREAGREAGREGGREGDSVEGGSQGGRGEA